MTQQLPFLVGREIYSLPLGQIQEVVENRVQYPFSAAPRHFNQAIAFHGRIVPVVHLPLLLNFPADKLCDRLIVTADDYGPFALAVDQVFPIAGMEPGAQKQASMTGRPYVGEVFVHQGKIINLLDLKQVQAAVAALCLS